MAMIYVLGLLTFLIGGFKSDEELLTMPTSNWRQISTIMDRIIHMQPCSIMDVGVGFGKMGMLCREYLEVWQRRYNPAEWVTRIDGIEIFQQYQNPVYYCYNNVYFGDVMDYLSVLGQYELVLLIDVLEHLEKPDGVLVLEAISDHYIVATPSRGTIYRDCAFGNERESHVSIWSPADFATWEQLDDCLVAWR